MRALERENSELKAARLMNLFPGGSQPKPTSQASSAASAAGQTERLIEALKVQLSEKMNDYLRVKEENERLKEEIDR